MTPLHFPLFLSLYINVLCLGAGHKGSGEYRNSLNLVNNLRSCSIESTHRGINLPELSAYSQTTNSVVNSVVEDEYTIFWKELQERGHEQDMDQLILRSKGSCIARFHHSKYAPHHWHFNAESKVLRPLFTCTLRAPFLKCCTLSLEKGLNCIAKVLKNCGDYGAFEKEMIMCVIKFLNISVYIFSTSFHNIQAWELESLLSDDSALSCIQTWDRNASIARILFLTFRLNARIIVSHLTENKEESQVIATMQNDLQRIIQTEFPCNMIKEVRREIIAPAR